MLSPQGLTTPPLDILDPKGARWPKWPKWSKWYWNRLLSLETQLTTTDNKKNVLGMGQNPGTVP